MSAIRDGQALHDFLGSTQIFTSVVNDLMEQQLRGVTDDGLTFSQLKLLKMVSRTEGYSVSNVAQFLGVSTAAASRAVDRLVRRGLVDRAVSADDRRAVRLSLTEEGEALLGTYDRAADRALARIFGDVPAEQMRQVGDLLDRLSLVIVERANGHDEVCFRCGIHFRHRCLLRQRRSRGCFFHVHERRPPDRQSSGIPGEGAPPGPPA